MVGKKNKSIDRTINENVDNLPALINCHEQVCLFCSWGKTALYLSLS